MTALSEFLNKFKENQQIALNASAKTINKTLLDMTKKIVDRTPIGDPNLWHPPYWPKNYVPGTLKKSWGISFTNDQRAPTGQFASTEQVLSSGGLSFKVGNNKSQVAVIYNSQPYAQRVETGWSTQAPEGMMRVTISEYTSLLGSNAAKYRVS
jgi:hypothetical protein